MKLGLLIIFSAFSTLISFVVTMVAFRRRRLAICEHIDLMERKISQKEKKKIVIIDQDQKVIQGLKRCLSDYDVINFDKGRDALGYIIRSGKSDVIILEAKLPQENGINLLKEIKNFNRDIPVMILTAFGSKDLVMEALRNHADEFAEKPFNANEIKKKVGLLFRQKEFRKFQERVPNNKGQRPASPKREK